MSAATRSARQDSLTNLFSDKISLRSKTRRIRPQVRPSTGGHLGADGGGLELCVDTIYGPDGRIRTTAAHELARFLVATVRSLSRLSFRTAAQPPDGVDECLNAVKAPVRTARQGSPEIPFRTSGVTCSRRCRCRISSSRSSVHQPVDRGCRTRSVDTNCADDGAAP